MLNQATKEVIRGPNVMVKQLVKEITFNTTIGDAVGAGKTLQVGNVVLFVGSNGSGKSQALRDIETDGSTKKVVNSIGFNEPDFDEMMKLLEPFMVTVPNFTNESQFQLTRIEYNGEDRPTGYPITKNALKGFKTGGRSALLWSNVIRLTGKSRFALSSSWPSPNFNTSPKNVLDALLRNDAARVRIRQLFFEAFGKYLVIDPRSMQTVGLRTSKVEPPQNIERSFTQESLDYFRGTSAITKSSDGEQAYATLLCYVESLPHKLILIEEPEAFLHPPLARRLGGALTKIAVERNANLFIATHSPDFLLGSIETNPHRSTVVRLGFENSHPTVHALATNDLIDIIVNPLIRHSGAVSAVFHKSAVVTEAEGDRVFYDEINRRLLQEGRGGADVSFLFANGWHSIRKILTPMRKIGIPTAAILDLDTILEAQFLEFCPEFGLTDTDTLSKLVACQKCLQSFGRSQLKENGLALIANGADLTLARECLRLLMDKGIFLVPVGELEGWLATYNFRGTGRSAKKQFLQRSLTALAWPPGTPDAIAVGNDDIWKFVEDLATWLQRNP